MDALRPTGAPVRSYRTTFPLDETPISEGGLWVNARTDGIDWCDVVTKGGVVFGEVTRMGVAEQRAEQGNLDGPAVVVEGELAHDPHLDPDTPGGSS